MKIPSIHVGCGKFSLQRLEILYNGNQFTPVACVDINVKKAQSDLLSFKGNLDKNLCEKVYTTITEAKEKHDAKACFIYASAKAHSKLIIESLKLGMHTLCVKPIACNQQEFKNIISIHNSNPNLMLLQGFNNQCNEAALKMREWLIGDNGIGNMLGGECTCWGRQNMKTTYSHPEVTFEGMYFYALACHQLSQLVIAKGLPKYVTAYVHNRVDSDLGFTGVWGTTGGQCLFEYPGGIPFSYTGTRAAHGNIFGLASRWSGQWSIHGENGDIRREGGRLILYRKGEVVEDYFLKDLDINLIEDEKYQFNSFYEALIKGKNKEWLQQSSLDTWILMEACNESAKENRKISIYELKDFLMK